MECHYKQAVDVFVETFNKALSLEPPAKFDEIIAISTSLHPLERECVFGPILRFTYNAMIDKGLLAGSKLELHPHAILLQPQTVQFANAWGAQISSYMNQQQFSLEAASGLPADVAERMRATRFEVGEAAYYCDRPPSQKLDKGKLFNLDLVYADRHLNYTLGSTKLNEEQNRQVTTARTERGGIYATGPANGTAAPLARPGLDFATLKTELVERINLQRAASSEEPQTPSP